MALDGRKHVMLSYNWNSQALVSKIYDILVGAGINVWMDIKGGMRDNTIDRMAEGIENADVVCCFMTPDYQESQNDRRELEYANKKRVRIIPCMIGDKNDRKWRPSGLLGLITAGLIHIDFRDDSDSKIQSQTTELINRIKNQSSVSTTVASPAPFKVFAIIRQKYLRENRIKRIVNEEKSFPIEQGYTSLSMVETKEQQEKERKLKQQNKGHNDHILSTFEEIYETKTTIDVENILKQCKDQIKKVLVLGRAGIGKSTFCQYITYHWAKDEILSEYDLVILIQLRKLTDSRYPSGKHYSPVDLVKNEYFPYDDLSNEEKQRFREQCNTGKVLWVLDGYDEVVQNIPEQLIDTFNYLLETQHHILTSRPYAITLSYDVKIEITGFTNDHIAKYVDQYFDQIKDEIPDASVQGQKLLNFFYSNPRIRGVAHIPVNLELICSVWGDTNWLEKKTLTMTELYNHITEWLCRRYLKKQNIHPDQKRKQWVYSQCDKELQFLETLAFNAMESNNIILPPTLLENTGHETHYCLDEHPQLLNFGILISYDDKPTGNQTQAEKQHYFVHLSFQEHFAARHLLKTLNSSDKQKATNFINKHKYDQRFQLVFIFASGLLAQSDYMPCMDVFWSTIQGEPLDLVGLKHIKLIIECIDELGDRTIFRERVGFLRSISQCLDLCVRAKSSIITENLIQSITHTTFILNTTVMQNKLLELMTSPIAATRQKTLYIISESTIPEPTPKFLSTICAALHDDDSHVKEKAAEALGKMDEKAATSEVIAALLNALRDNNSHVREKAAEALGKMGEKATTNEVIYSLSNAMRDENSHVREKAAEALKKMGAKAVTNETIAVLILALRDNDAHVRENAAEAIWKMGEKAVTNETIVAFIHALRDNDSHVREKVAEVLWEMIEKAATDKVIVGLINALQNEDPYVREKAAETLGKMGEKVATEKLIAGLSNALYDEGSYVREKAAETLGKIGEKAATAEVICRLTNAMEDEDSHVREKAAEALGKMGEKVATTEVMDRLSNAMQDEGSHVREKAAEALRKIGEKAATTEVSNAMRDENSHGKEKTVLTSGKMGEKAAMNTVVDALINALQNEDSNVRGEACEALGNMGEKAATTNVIERLATALGDEDDSVVEYACEALWKIGEKAATDKIINQLMCATTNVNVIIKRSACKGLGRIGTKAATYDVIERMIALLDDPVEIIRIVTCEALVNLGERAVTSEVIEKLASKLDDNSEYVIRNACKSLKMIGKNAVVTDAISKLVAKVVDPQPAVRRRACLALGEMSENAETHDVITSLVTAFRDQDKDVRSYAYEAIGKFEGKLGIHEVISGLVTALLVEKDYGRHYAYEALAKMSDKADIINVTSRLLTACLDENKDVSSYAYEVLGKMGEKVATNEIIGRLVNALGDKTDAVRLAACEALTEFSEYAITDIVIDGLVGMLDDENEIVKHHAFKALGKLGEKAATVHVISRLVIAMKDKNQNIRRYACETLWRIGEKAATNDVIDQLMCAVTDKDSGVIWRACRALERMGQGGTTQKVINIFLDVLNDSTQLALVHEVTVRTVNTILTMSETLKQLDSATLTKVVELHEKRKLLCNIPVEQLISVFLETGNLDLLNVIISFAYDQEIAITVTNGKIIIYSNAAIIEFYVTNANMVEQLIKRFREQIANFGMVVELEEHPQHEIISSVCSLS